MSPETPARPLKRIPWDCAALGIDCFELSDASEATLGKARARGHYTVRVDPLAPKEPFHRHGFYYCDTLIEPYCGVERIQWFPHDSARLELRPPMEAVLAAGRAAFAHGRFHRDFNIDRESADLRYENWLKSLHAQGKVYGLVWDGRLAGFVAHEDGKLVLHAIAQPYRGRGIAKYLWSAVCLDLKNRGAREISSSISAANLAAVNLYASLGFHFRNAVDIYHRMVL